MFIRVRNDRLINFDAVIQLEIKRDINEDYCGLFGRTAKENEGRRITIIRFGYQDGIDIQTAYQICEKILDAISVRAKSNIGIIDMRPNIKNILKQYVPEMTNIDKKFCL